MRIWGLRSIFTLMEDRAQPKVMLTDAETVFDLCQADVCFPEEEGVVSLEVCMQEIATIGIFDAFAKVVVSGDSQAKAAPAVVGMVGNLVNGDVVEVGGTRVLVHDTPDVAIGGITVAHGTAGCLKAGLKALQRGLYAVDLAPADSLLFVFTARRTTEHKGLLHAVGGAA